MNECIGLFGHWFGHKFKNFWVTRTPPTLNGIIDALPFEPEPEDLFEFIARLTITEYAIHCKRCGTRLPTQK